MRPVEASRVIAPWTKFITRGLPYVSLKLALSLDGRIATHSGSSKWVTGAEARALVHMLRARRNAVAIGIGTALADNPRLTVRDASGVSATRVVFDTKLRLRPHSVMVQPAVDVPTWVVCSADAPMDREEMLTASGVEVLRAPTSAEGRLDAGSALMIAAKGVVTLMVEGGTAAGSILAGQPGRRAARVRGSHPARAARQAGGGGLGRYRDPRRGAPHRDGDLGALGADTYVCGPLQDTREPGG